MANLDAWLGSEYYESLLEDDQKHYKLKLTLAHGSMLPDPYTLSDWKDDVTLMPDVSWIDIQNYLINTPSSFTSESLKAYKSLDAYNFFICAHVQDVFIHQIDKDSEFCFIKSEVSFLSVFLVISLSLYSTPRNKMNKGLVFFLFWSGAR